MADLQIRDLTVEYALGGYVIRPIDNLSLEASSGELVLLLGPSGCGKTTLLSCLAAILTPTRGEIEVFGMRVTGLAGESLGAYRRNTVGIVFQAFNLIPSLSAIENVAAPMIMAGKPRRDAQRHAAALIERVGLTDRSRHRPGDLSGGQQQRVAIARALAHDPPLLLADEPTAHLDYIQVESVLGLLRELAAPGRLVVVATHDPRMVPLADRVVELAPSLASGSQPPEHVELSGGQVLFEQGSRGQLIYVVERGEIEIVRIHGDRSEELVTIVKAGEHFGELGPLLGLPRTATARARTPTSVTGYTVRDFRGRANDDPKLAKLFSSAAAGQDAQHRARGA